METILALLISNNSIKLGGMQILYWLLIAIFIVYVVSKNRQASLILNGFLLLCLFLLVASLTGKEFLFDKTIDFGIKVLFGIILSVYITYNRYKWSMTRWAYTLSIVNGAETVAALLLKQSDLWKHQFYGNEESIKLQLYYFEPSVLCFVSGALLIFFMNKCIKNGISIILIVCSLICLADMYYSFSLSGIVCTVLALALLLIMMIGQNKKKKLSNPRALAIWAMIFCVLGLISILAMYNSRIYMQRIQAILHGEDVGLQFTVTKPIILACEVMKTSLGRGLGIGTVNGVFNSFFKLIIETGIAGAIAILCIFGYLLVLCLRYGNAFDMTMLFFIFLIQNVSGEFTNPINWLIYGWIAADCFDTRDEFLELQNDKEFDRNQELTVAIIGAKGFANYGGYETFVDKLTEYHADNKHIKYLVACKKNGIGHMDETKVSDVISINRTEFIYHNANCFKITVPQLGDGQAIIYDLLAARHAINYFKKHKINKPVLYILSCRIGPFIRWISGAMHELGGVYILNPDGHEFLRARWSANVRKYWKTSEKLMVKYADKIVCDSKNIETYINAAYEEYKPDTTYIAYGADTQNHSKTIQNKVDSKITDQCADDTRKKYLHWKKKYEIEDKNYYLIVGRFVPENNYETMIREYMKADTKKKLVIITNVNSNYLNELDQELAFSNDKKIKFVGTVYDQSLLKMIRQNAYGYIHGHEVGGTNPSLLESLQNTKLNLLLNVGFNRECGEDAAVYWEKKTGSLSALINRCENMSEWELDEISQKAKKRIEDAYSCQYIADCYEELFSEVRRKIG